MKSFPNGRKPEVEKRFKPRRSPQLQSRSVQRLDAPECRRVVSAANQSRVDL
jgi:hypothetical protein